ncbi:MAG: hypothetical protein H7Z42_11360 [Roseiflexaceae bacterium]|nr:hypothetical protein [Roseiflexaceae bacterium]
MITIWTFIMLGLVLLPCGVLGLVVLQTWLAEPTTAETVGTAEHEA